MANFIPKIEYTHPIDGATTITFDLPPEGDNINESVRGVGRDSVSSSGSRQTQWNFNQENRTFNFVFLTESLITALRKLYTDHALKGGTFDYYEHSDEVDFITVELAKKEFKPNRLTPQGSGFIYDLKMEVVRTL